MSTGELSVYPSLLFTFSLNTGPNQFLLCIIKCILLHIIRSLLSLLIMLFFLFLFMFLILTESFKKVLTFFWSTSKDDIIRVDRKGVIFSHLFSFGIYEYFKLIESSHRKYFFSWVRNMFWGTNSNSINICRIAAGALETHRILLDSIRRGK